MSVTAAKEFDPQAGTARGGGAGGRGAAAGRSGGRLLLACVAIVAVSSVLGWAVQTSGGRVVVRSVTIPTQNGQ